MRAVRRAEVIRACAILGVDHQFLGFADSGLPGPGDQRLPEGCFARVPLAAAAEPLVRMVRSLRPHVMITYDETGGYPHPDHVMCHKISVTAFEAAGDPGQYATAGAPWQPEKLYYHANFHRLRFLALHAEMRRRQAANACLEWQEHWGEPHEGHPWQDLPVTTRVQCDEYFETRDRALMAHFTQIDPNGFWLAYPPDVQGSAWPTEDFCLARSMVDTSLPEDDLFAGIRVSSPVTADIQPSQVP